MKKLYIISILLLVVHSCRQDAEITPEDNSKPATSLKKTEKLEIFENAKSGDTVTTQTLPPGNDTIAVEDPTEPWLPPKK